MIKKKLRYIFPVTKKTYSNENEIWVKNWKITNNKINSKNIMMQVSFIGVRVFLGEKKKKILVSFPELFFLKNPI